MRKRKKVLLFLVEGITDRITFELALTKLLQNERVEFLIMDGDITYDPLISADTIVRHVGDTVRRVEDRYKFRPGDFFKVVHIIDTDAAFIPDAKVLDGSMNPEAATGGKATLYDPQRGIWTQHVKAVRERNHQKKQKVQRLCAQKQICRYIPYGLYYLSMNLEHVLYNRPNVSTSEKLMLAKQKEKEYIRAPQTLLSFFLQPAIAKGGGEYRGSWQYIFEGNHSLGRCSNLNILLTEIQEAGLMEKG